MTPRLLLTVVMMSVAILRAETPWADAREAYNRGDFREALTLYEGLRRTSGVSPALDYNLGNTLMRLGEPDRALAHYRRALWLDPGDPDVKANLALAAERTGARLPALPPPRRFTGFLTFRQWRGGLIAACWLLAAAGLGRRWISPLRRGAPWILPALGGLLILMAAGVWGSRPGPMLEEAVLRGDTVTARFEPLSDATEHFSLPGGSVVRLEDHNRDWVRISADGKRGWVKKENVLELRKI